MKQFLFGVLLITFFLRVQPVEADGLGSQLLQQRRAQVGARLSSNTAAVIFSGRLRASGLDSPVPQPFTPAPDFLYLTDLHLPNSVLVIFPDPISLKEGPASEILFVPDDKQLPLNTMGYDFKEQFGRVTDELVVRSVAQWQKFCLEVLDADMTERILTRPVDPGDFAIYRQNYQFQPPVQVFFRILAPNFQAQPEVIQHYTTILRSDTSRLAADQRQLDAWLGYYGQAPDPLLKRFLKVRTPVELKSLQNDVRQIKFDFEGLVNIMQRLREKKSSGEQEKMRSASKLAATALKAGAQLIAPGVPELRIAGEIDYQMAKNGARPGRSTQVIATPTGGRYLYAQSSGQLPETGVVILDAVVRKDDYSAHIARTFPVKGGFGGQDGRLYDAAEAAHRAVLQGCKAGTAPTQWCTQRREALMKALDATVLESGSRRSWRDEYAFVSVFPIGIDLYEFDNPEKMAAGMAFEVETLVSIPENRKFKREYQGRSVRLKDVVIVGNGSVEILTRSLPLGRTEVEQMVGTGE